MDKKETKSNEPEVIELNKTSKIKFFKKVWYSIAKPSKYEEMREDGIGSAIKYFLLVLAILSIIISIVLTIIQVNIVKDDISYLEKKLPEMSFKDNTLSLESEEATILDEDVFKQQFGRIVVINPLLNEEQAIKEYQDLAKDYSTVVFLSNEYIVIKNNYNPENENKEGIEVHKYSDESSKYIKDNSATYTKEHVIAYLSSQTPYTYYLSYFFVGEFLSIGLVFIFIILLVTLSLWLVTKLSKMKWGFKKSLMNTIYSSTLSMIVYVAYMIILYLTKFSISFIDVITVMLIFIYIFILLLKEKNAKTKTEN